ncbi:MAG: Gfo/Idh/MocA family protein [Magnetospiraceae bacterium]
MRPLRWGIVGTAKIALTRVIPAMATSKLCQITAIASRDGARARSVAQQLGIPKAYGSYEELLADPDIDAIYNPLPNHLHVPLSLQAAERGKHVLCEKPIALTAAAVESLIAARDRYGVVMAEAFMIRHHPQWQKTRALLQDGALGPVRSVVGMFSYMNADPENIRNKAEMGGGSLYDIGVYPIVAARYLFGAEPLRVTAQSSVDPTFGTDLLTSALLTFPQGQALFTCSTQSVTYQRIQVLCARGRIELRVPFNAPPEMENQLWVDNGAKLADQSARAVAVPAADQYQQQGEAFSRAVLEGAPLEFGLEDSLANMRVVDALFTAARTQSWINV